jgi:cytochrome P450 family 6
MTLLAGYWGFDIIIILLSVVVITAYFYMTRNFNYWRKRGIPEIPPTPFVGNFGKCFFMKSASNLLKEFHNQAKGQPYIGFYIFDKPALLICDRKLLQKILIKDFNYFRNRYGIADKKDRMGYANLFSIENPAWKTVRMKLSSFFTSAKLKNTLNLILQNAKNLEDYLDTLELKGKYIIYESHITHVVRKVHRNTS